MELLFSDGVERSKNNFNYFFDSEIPKRVEATDSC